MKKWILFLMVFTASVARAEVVNEVSEYLLSEQLYLVQEGDYAPHQADDGATVLRYLPNQTCSSSQDGKCDGLLLSFKKSNLNECTKPSLAFRFDELPVTLNQGYKGVFTVPSITEPTTKAHDYFVFYSNKTSVCYEFDWGTRGLNFEQHINLANNIIDKGY